MKIIIIYSLFLLLLTSFISCKEVPESKINFDHGWKFYRVDQSEKEDPGFEAVSFDDSGWTAVSLPHTAHVEPLVVNHQWQGICWYRKTFKVPDSFKTKKVYIELEAAMNYSKIWINGILVKEHQGGYLPVVMDVTKYLVFGRNNIIAVRLNNTDNPITGPKPLKILDFNMYGGLYRDAWMIVKDKVHISNPLLAGKIAGGGVFITYPEVSTGESVVQVKTNVINESDMDQPVELVQSVFYDGKLVSQVTSEKTIVKAGNDADLTEKIKVANAKLWSPSHPNLYQLVTKVVAGGKVVDQQKNHFGIRSFEFKGHDLYINGQKTFLRGVNRHHEYPFIGYALSDNAQYRDAKKIKDAGFDYVRLCHYPQSPAFLDACDKLGLVVLDAILGWQYYADNDQFRNYCYHSAAQLIRRDRNHPCVLAWEVSLNETKMPDFFMKKLDGIVHAEYPDNAYSCGWIDGDYNIFLQARQHRFLHPKEYQEHDKSKPYIVSEYGDWEYYSRNAGFNQDKMPEQQRIEKSSRQLRAYGEARLLQQVHNVQEAHNDNLNTIACADGYWVMYDYNRGVDNDLESSGVMDIFRLPKFSYYFFQSQRNSAEDTILRIASYWTPQSPLNIKVYSNCDEVAFYLNGKLIAKQKPDHDSISTNLAHPPFTFKFDSFEPGTIKAVGFINGEKVAENAVSTPGEAKRLKLWLDESGKKPEAGCNDVLFLYVAAVDQNGTIVPGFDGVVHLKIKGDAQVMNVGKIKAEAGIATALIRIGDFARNVNITVTSQNLKEGKIDFQVM